MTRLRSLATAALAGALVASLSACATYDARYSYSPAPASARVHAVADGPADARVLASVVGVRRNDDDGGLPAGVEIRLRVENLGDEPVEVDGSRLQLVTADLAELPLVAVEPGGAMVAPPRRTSGWRLYYGYPAGVSRNDLDLGGLDLSWTLVVRGRSVSGSSGFVREAPVPVYYDPYFYGDHCPWYYPRFHLGYYHHY